MQLQLRLVLAFLAAVSFATAAVHVPIRRRVATGVPSNMTFKVANQKLYEKYSRLDDNYFRNTGRHLRSFNATTMRKYLANAKKLKSRATGKTTLTEETQWSGEIGVGSEGKKALVVFDTGSTDLMLDKKSYEPSESKSSNNLHEKFAFSYGSLDVWGDLYADDISIGDARVKDVAIGYGAENFDGDTTGGTFGLAFPWLSQYKTDKHAFAASAKDQEVLDRNVYQFTYRSKGEASLNVGHIDESEIDGGLAWVDVDSSEGFWKTEIAINGKKKTGIVDSGTTFVSGPNSEMKEVLSGIKKLEVYTDGEGNIRGRYKCNDPPTITFKVAGKDLKLSRQGIHGDGDGNTCDLAFAGADGLNDWIFGATFFQAGSIVFDLDKERMGFGKQSSKK